jgi:hypothetical protein
MTSGAKGQHGAEPLVLQGSYFNRLKAERIGGALRHRRAIVTGLGPLQIADLWK